VNKINKIYYFCVSNGIMDSQVLRMGMPRTFLLMDRQEAPDRQKGTKISAAATTV
jgi:hypothetical protein